MKTTDRIVCMLAFLPLGLPVAKADSNNRLTAMDIFEIEFASDPQISPNGTQVVYVRQFADVMTDGRYSNLWIVNFDGTDHRPLTHGNRHDSSPRWAPAGKRLIYLSDEEGSTQIYMRWMDTGQTTKLTHLEHSPSGISWSPDGTMCAFSSFVPSEPTTIADMPTPPKEAKWADPPQVIDKITYRFDKRGYIKHGYNHLFVMPAEPGTPRQVTQGDFHYAGGWRGSVAVWTPDSQFLIVSANLREDYEYEPMDTEIHEVRVSDGATRALTSRFGPDGSPAVSPEGTKIAYVGFDDRYQGYQVTRLYVMNRDGSESRVLMGDLDRSVRSPRWTGDGSGLLFLYDNHGRSRLALTTMSGEVSTLAEGLGGRGGASYTVSRNNRFAMNHTTPHIPSDIAVGSLSDSSTRVLTHVNRDLLGHKTLGDVEAFWYESSKDGRKIQGWIIKPPGFDPGKKYPLILAIHGGPFANYGDRFDLEMQIWAAKGYAILYTNPRGSTSYGEEFGNLIHHAYPGDDFFDLDAGVDAVIAKGYIDPDQLFVTGGSGGGVLTCWMIGRSNRFRAAVAAYPVINWYSFTLTADLSVFFYKYWFPGLPWDHTEHYMKRSLLSVVANVKTPTMVITGEEDWRTPISESEQYYKALKLLKVDSVMIRVPGEPHGIRQKPSHHVAKVLNIVGWFEKYRATEN